MCPGVTQFSDLTQAEFEAQHMGGYRPTPGHTAATRRRAASASAPAKRATQLPESVDWRDKVSCYWWRVTALACDWSRAPCPR